MNPATLDLSALPSILLTERRKLPNRPGVYLAINSLGIVQYVGQSISLKQRWSGHNRLDELTVLQDIQISWIECDTALLPDIEAALLDYFKPPLNNKPQKREGVAKIIMAYPVPQLGKQLRQFRDEKGMAPAEVAYKAGISVGHLYRIENDDLKSLPIETLEHICNALGVSMEETFTVADWLARRKEDSESGSPTVADSFPTPATTVVPPVGVSKSQQILEILRESAEPLDAKTIAQTWGLNENTVKTMLNKMAKEDLVERVNPGAKPVKWTATE